MDISLNRVATQVASATTKKSPASPEGAPANTALADDAVEIATPSLKVNDLKAGAASASGIDQEKVNRIANAIQNGRYTIDANKIAEKMIASEFEIR